MTLLQIFIFAAIALVTSIAPLRLRGGLLFFISIVAIYWLQPIMPIRYLDFWLPTATLFIAVLGWFLTSAPDQRTKPETFRSVGLMIGGIILLALTRYLEIESWLLASRPPQIGTVLAVILFPLFLFSLARKVSFSSRAIWGGILFLIILFVTLKTPALAESASVLFRTLNQQNTTSATALDIRWLGFSYIAFRLIHTLRDRQTGRLPESSLQEYVTYLLFFPAFVAGPIDRIERFIKDLRKEFKLAGPDVAEAGRRLFIGLFKKFVVADTLAIIALNAHNAAQIRSTGWAWVMLYAYTIQIYFDFSGYTDIAIGLGRLAGIQLPENFSMPYRRANLTHFWNNWHMTLTQWVRAYVFHPMTRWLRSMSRPIPVWSMIFVTQLTTMVLIGLWHGITWNFVIWGAWHGIGLFTHNRWSDFIRRHAKGPAQASAGQKVLNVAGWALTFNYVALGWVWFVLPDPALAGQIFLKLGGL